MPFGRFAPVVYSCDWFGVSPQNPKEHSPRDLNLSAHTLVICFRHIGCYESVCRDRVTRTFYKALSKQCFKTFKKTRANRSATHDYPPLSRYFPRHSGSFLTHRIFRIPEINGGSLAYSTICPKAFPKNNQFPDKSALGRLYFLNAHRALEQINNN